MRGFVEIPKDWLGPAGSFLLGPLNINVNHITAYYRSDTGKYIELSDGRRFLITAPMSSLEYKIQEAFN